MIWLPKDNVILDSINRNSESRSQKMIILLSFVLCVGQITSDIQDCIWLTCFWMDNKKLIDKLSRNGDSGWEALENLP